MYASERAALVVAIGLSSVTAGMLVWRAFPYALEWTETWATIIYGMVMFYVFRRRLA